MSERESGEVKCDLPPDQLEARKRELRRGLVTRIEAARELADGLALRFAHSGEIEAEVAQFIEFERGCCGFAKYSTREDSGKLWLEIRGPAGTGEFARELVPTNVPIERRSQPAGRRLLRLGIASGAAAVFAFVCCATPMLAIGMSALGLAGATASVALGLDLIGVSLLAVSLPLLGVGLWRRRSWSRRDVAAELG